jgi:hypothetical protein
MRRREVLRGLLKAALKGRISSAQGAVTLQLRVSQRSRNPRQPSPWTGVVASTRGIAASRADVARCRLGPRSRGCRSTRLAGVPVAYTLERATRTTVQIIVRENRGPCSGSARPSSLVNTGWATAWKS